MSQSAPACVCVLIRQHTSAYVRTQHTEMAAAHTDCCCAYVRIQHTENTAYVRIQHKEIATAAREAAAAAAANV